MRFIFGLLSCICTTALTQSFINSKPKSTSTTYWYAHKKKSTLAFLRTLPTDTLAINGSLCLNYNLDSLSNETVIYNLTLNDIENNITLVRWTPFLGSLKIEKINDQKFVFNGSALYPVNGNWNTPFIRHETIRYVLDINTQSYQIYRDQNVKLRLPYSESKLKKLRDDIMDDTICFSQNWDTAASCFPKIEIYEYNLFAALLNNNTMYQQDYINLRQDIPLVNAGQFSEYYEGCISLLALYGIIDQSDYNLISLMRNSQRSNSPDCY